MKRKLMTILAGVIVAVTPGAIAVAQTPTPAPLPTTVFPGLAELNLTEQQQEQLNQLQAQTRSELESILSEDQRSQFRTTMQSGGGFRQAIAAMDLTADQQSQLRDVFESARTQFQSILTAEQQQQLRETLRSRWMQRRQPSS